MSIKGYLVRISIAFVAIGLTSSAFVYAAEYPTRPVQVIIPWAVGGGTDLSTRALINATQKYFPKPLVAMNRPGGAGTVGMTEICMAKPDGYTIGSNAWGPMVTQPALQKLRYSERDYIPIMQTYSAPRTLVAHPSRPYKTMKELMEYAKKHPGEVKVGIVGTGATDHLAFIEMEKKYGTKFNLIPIGGGGPQVVAVVGGHVDIAACTPEIYSAVLAHQVVALGVMDLVRFPPQKEIPSLGEQGYPIESGVANFLVVPAGVPENIIKFIHDAFKKGLDNPAYQEPVKKMGFNVQYLSPEESRKKIEKFRNLYIQLAKEFGLAPK
jgi:tripartite-type tricarboxylate transporter receptor subunit TctC